MKLLNWFDSHVFVAVLAFIALLLSLCAGISAQAGDAIIGSKVTKCYTYSAHMDDKYESLPALFEICKKLNIDKATCESNTFALNGFSQIDKSLWYTSVSSSPYEEAPHDCYKATAIQRYYTYDGTRGTSWACLAKPEDDEISPAEIDAIAQYAKRLNSIGVKNLRDHTEAMSIKQFAKSLGR